MTYVSHMYAYLMSPARMEEYLALGTAAVGGDDRILRYGSLAVRGDYALHTAFTFAAYRRIYYSVLGSRDARYRAHVFLSEFTELHIAREPEGAYGILSHEDYAARVSVEACDGAEDKALAVSEYCGICESRQTVSS